ncbi:MAG: hypothetical protein ACYDAQ_06580 [Mycobacteriales bacterium]
MVKPGSWLDAINPALSKAAGPLVLFTPQRGYQYSLSASCEP